MPQLVMPNIGEGVTEGTVVRWLKQEGDDVALDEPIVEVETDKAIVEIPSPVAGKLSKILVHEDEVVPVGAVLAEFEETGAESSVASAPKTNTATTAPTARHAQAASSANGAVAGNDREYRRTSRYSPVVLKLAHEHQVDLSLVRGTGVDGRVTRQDVLRYIENPVANSAPPSPTAGVVGVEREDKRAPARAQDGAPPPPVAGDESRDVVPLSATRRTIAARVTESHQTIPVAWMAVEADVTGLVELRERAKDEFERVEGVRLTYMPFFIQAFVAALKKHPVLNATYTEDGIVRHRTHHVGIAVATDSGLVVPVIRDAGDKSISGLARETGLLGEKARSRKLSIDDMRGASLTVDNTGAFGSIISQPIIPTGQAAIVTTEKIRQELRPHPDGSFGVRSVVNLCISFDHRIFDGAEAGAFMRTAKDWLEAVSPDTTLY
jgi:2-oxoisovalerate dehydrogenase E2 component (dihydrolipoyl transacylase)